MDIKESAKLAVSVLDEKLAENRLWNHDMYPEKIDNR